MNFSCFFAVGSSSSASSDCSLLLLVVNEWLFHSRCLEPPNGVNGASKRPFWRLQTPRTLPPVSPLLWFRHAPLGEHPLVIPPFLRGYRGGYCSPCRRHDFHDAEFAVLSLLDEALFLGHREAKNALVRALPRLSCPRKSTPHTIAPFLYT